MRAVASGVTRSVHDSPQAGISLRPEVRTALSASYQIGRSKRKEACSRYILICRRVFLMGLAGTAVLNRAGAAEALALSDMAIGDPDAPLTIIVYASMTCSQCATFHAAVLPKLKAEYIDTGKVRLIYRDFPLDAAALRAAALARCAGEMQYFGFLETLYEHQSEWARARDPMAALERFARVGGMAPGELKACLRNRAIEEYALESRLEAQSRFGIFEVPSFVIEGRTYRAPQSFEDLRRMIDPLLTQRAAP